MERLRFLGVACLTLLVAVVLAACAGEEDTQPPARGTVEQAIEEAEETPISEDVRSYARELCSPLGDFVEALAEIVEQYPEVGEENGSLVQTMAAIKAMKSPVQSFADQLQAISDVPQSVEEWHNDMVRSMTYLVEVLELIEQGGLLAGLALADEPTPEPVSEPPPELAAALLSECGEDLLARLEELDALGEAVEAPTEVPLSTASAAADTPAPTAPTEPAAPTGKSRADPVPRGQALAEPEGWEITVLDYVPDAWALVQAENQFNDPPAPGYRMMIIRVRVENVSADDPAYFSDSDLKLVGSENVAYTAFERSCGVIPDAFGFPELFRGGVIEGNVCFQVRQQETSLLLFTDFSFDKEDRRYFAVE